MVILMIDDENRFSEIFTDTAKKFDDNLEIVSFCDENNFIQCLCQRKKEINGVLIDIELGDKSGIDLAEEVHRLYPEIPVIFMTGYPEKYCQNIFLADYDLKPFAFITKPVEEQVVFKVFSQLRETTAENKKQFVIKVNGRNLTIDIDSIVYIESDRRQLTVHTADETLTVYGRLKTLADKLPDYFLMPHSSYLVNCKFVKGFGLTSVILKDDTELPLSRGRKTNFTDRLVYLKGFSKC